MKTLAIFFLSNIIFFNVFSQGNIPCCSLIEKIIDNQSYCVKKYSNDKIYIKAKNIEILENGIFIKISDNEFCSVPFLESNVEGCYLNASNSSFSIPSSSRGLCPYCETPTDGEGYCINIECKYYDRKVKY